MALERPVRVARRPMVAWAAFLAVVALASAVGEDSLYAWIGTDGSFPSRQVAIVGTPPLVDQRYEARRPARALRLAASRAAAAATRV